MWTRPGIGMGFLWTERDLSGLNSGTALAMNTYGHLRDEHSVNVAKKVTFALPSKEDSKVGVEESSEADRTIDM